KIRKMQVMQQVILLRTLRKSQWRIWRKSQPKIWRKSTAEFTTKKKPKIKKGKEGEGMYSATYMNSNRNTPSAPSACNLP
uniref:Uncharacterized protein n=1 Tax=Amphimedon queenslandica TaxID=400682 RepID=A0A1X7VSL6_AMPQE